MYLSVGFTQTNNLVSNTYLSICPNNLKSMIMVARYHWSQYGNGLFSQYSSCLIGDASVIISADLAINPLWRRRSVPNHVLTVRSRKLNASTPTICLVNDV